MGSINRKMMLACCTIAVVGMAAAAAFAQTAFPLAPSIAMEKDGTLLLKERKLPMPAMMSAEAKAKYLEIANRSLALKPMSREEIGRQFMAGAGAGIAAARDAVRKVYPVGLEETKIGGVGVEIYTPGTIAPRNRKRVLMMFNSDPTGVILAAIGRIKVIAVHYNPTTPQGNQQIVAVYRELLKSHKPGQIGWVGLSGGCQYGGNTAMWLPSQKLPLPGAIGLLTCAGGGSPGDSRNTLNGLDVQLSDYTTFAAMRTRIPGGAAPATAAAPAPSGNPQSEILNNAVPKGFPPSYVLTGTRDMCLSESVLLHRKLRNAGVITDLNIWEGMWHGFNMEPGLPEAREAAADLAAFLDRHLAI